jgi:threonine efflux protein
MLATLVTISLLHWIVLVTPGANVLLVAQLAAAGHRRSACYAALGITLVALIWASMAILGVSAVFVAHPRLRLGLQAVGGIYLCYVAFRLWRSSASASSEPCEPLTAGAALQLGFLTNIMNPKSALFFGSVFATALPQTPSALLLASAVTLVFTNALVWHMLLVVGFSQPRVQAAYARQRQRLARIAGAVLGMLGLRLLIAAAHEARVR